MQQKLTRSKRASTPEARNSQPGHNDKHMHTRVRTRTQLSPSLSTQKPTPLHSGASFFTDCLTNARCVSSCCAPSESHSAMSRPPSAPLFLTVSPIVRVCCCCFFAVAVFRVCCSLCVRSLVCCAVPKTHCDCPLKLRWQSVIVAQCSARSQDTITGATVQQRTRSDVLNMTAPSPDKCSMPHPERPGGTQAGAHSEPV